MIGGNVQFGELAANVALASSSANLSFANNVSLGASTRTLTLGNSGTVTFSGVISNTANNGLTFAATAGGTGRFEVTNATNTFIGDLKFTGGEVRFTGAGSLGNVNNNLIIDGGRLATISAATYTLASTHAITVGDTAGTSISTPGAGVLTYDGTIADLAGKTGAWAKQGGGTLALGGVSNYSGATFINNGVLQLTTGNDRLPTGTVVNLGQAVSTNLGTLDLNGRNQRIAGLNSTTGTNATASNNTVTSSTSATLTIGGTGNYNYGDATNTNSGIIAGAISLVKSGSGTQTLGDANIFTGAGAPTLLSHLFSSFSATGGLDSSGGVAGQGLFSFNGSTATLNWTAVPEPTSGLAVIVLGAGLMRRRRMA